jgi:hypothetical protein
MPTKKLCLHCRLDRIIEDYVDETGSDPRECMVHLLRCVIEQSHELPPEDREQAVADAFAEAIAFIMAQISGVPDLN